MDHNFTKLIGDWLNTPESKRDYTVGALYLLKLSGNKIMYANIVANIDRRHEIVEYQLQKYYNFRVKELTHAQVEEMQQKVDAIVEKHIPLAANADTQRSASVMITTFCRTVSRLSMLRTFLCSNVCANFTSGSDRSRWRTSLAPTPNATHFLRK